MKLLIAYILAATTSLMADIVHLSWSYTDPVANFRIYTGSVPYVGEAIYVIPAELRRASIEVPDNHYIWMTAMGLNGLESEPTPAIQYRPVTVELVIQQTKNLQEWGGRVGVFAFRVPDAVAGEITQRLNVTKTHVEARAYGQTFRVPVPTKVGKKFFRSYVAVAP